MVYQGRVENGVIVLDDSVRLPEGAEVQISLREVESPTTSSHRSIEEEIADIIATVPARDWEQLPDDLSDQLDHYVYGVTKR